MMCKIDMMESVNTGHEYVTPERHIPVQTRSWEVLFETCLQNELIKRALDLRVSKVKFPPGKDSL